MNTKTILFIGPPGSGKGTQAKLVVDFLRQASDREVLYVGMGEHFRQLADTDSQTGRLVKEALRTGEILPSFLATSFWAQDLSHNLEEDLHLVIDGSPRTEGEASQLAEALRFYRRVPATIIHLPISEAETRVRLADRHRSDDEKKIIDVRLAEYRAKTEPTIAFCEESADYNLVTIDGEQSIEAIQEQIQEVLTND